VRTEVMQQTLPYAATSRRGLILHDSLAFLALLGASVALFGVTLFLFNSFQAHRADLAQRWSARGRMELSRNQPEQAVSALRTALSYGSEGTDERANQLLLAQALDAAGHTDEATNYFLNLHDATPGDGSINLQLARLARRKDDEAEADNYYRAAIYGSWEGDAVIRRRQTRLELADYLIQQHQLAEARNELFTVAGNAPADVQLDLDIARKLETAGFVQDALTFYQKAATADPHARLPLELAGTAAYNLGDYAEAERLLNHALVERPAPNHTAEQQQHLEALAENARRIQQLNLTRDQPAAERADHILNASKIAQARLQSCLKANPSSTLTSLNARWTAATAGTAGDRRTLLENAAAQDTWTNLVYTTEQDTAPPLNPVCGQPTGDDALLLRLADAAQPVSAPAPQVPAAIPDANRPSLVRRIFGAGSKTATKEQTPNGK
jgi:tetratricopeptide (TPR) repeat protein